MALIGEPRIFHNKWKFQLEIDDIGRCAFQSCSELSIEVAKIEYYEGGMIRPYKEAGRMNVPDLTLERAATVDDAFRRWVEQVSYGESHRGQNTPSYKRNGTIVQFDRENQRVRTWTLFELWPVKYTAGSWDNNSDEFVMEQLVLAVGWFSQDINNEGGGGATTVIGEIAKAVKRVGW